MRYELKRRDLLPGRVCGRRNRIAALGVRSRGACRDDRPSDFAAGRGREPAVASGAEAFSSGSTPARFAGRSLRSSRRSRSRDKAGYQAMEPWIDELERYAASGGLSKTWVSGFATHRSPSRARSASSSGSSTTRSEGAMGLEAARRSMELVRGVGGKRLAAPPVGATDRPMTDLLKIADRYRELLEMGDQIGVVPQVEVWGARRR